MKKHTHLYSFAITLLVIIGFVFTGCKDDFKPEDSFIKVYDDQDLNRDYFPLSMYQTSDNGYLILSAYNNSNIHLLKTDNVGNLLWETDLASNYVNALPTIIDRSGELYFICMDAIGFFTYVMKVDENTQSAVEFQTFVDIQYPLAVADNQTSVYIQNYERLSFETGVYKLNSALDQIENSGFVNINVDVEDKVLNHLNFTGKRFPFFVGITPEADYLVVNGFHNYSFSAIFMDANMDFSGVYSGAAFDGSLNAILPLGANKFAISRYSFSDMYVNPNATLSPTAIDISEAILSEWKSELDADSPILIKNITINSTDYTAYLATTKSNQLILDFYLKGSDEIAGSKYLGESVPLKAADLSITEDGGLMILTQVTVMSSFNRVATIKLSKAELELLVE